MPEGGVLALIAVVSAALALAKAGYDLYAGRKRDKQSLEIAKKQAPEVQKQLELGNFRAAMEGVNIAQTIMADELARMERRENELEEALRHAQKRADEAETRAVAAEKRAADAEVRAHQVEMRLGTLQRKCAQLEGEISQLRRELL